MSRSRRKTPKTGVTTAASEKREKLAAHRKERRIVRSVLRKDGDSVKFLHRREISDPWNMAKDGKIYWGKRLDAKELRK